MYEPLLSLKLIVLIKSLLAVNGDHQRPSLRTHIDFCSLGENWPTREENDGVLNQAIRMQSRTSI